MSITTQLQLCMIFIHFKQFSDCDSPMSCINLCLYIIVIHLNYVLWRGDISVFCVLDLKSLGSKVMYFCGPDTV